MSETPSASFPLAVLDFEASSLEHDGYPIEVGIAVVAGVQAEVESWSTLIRPTWTWAASGHWSKASQRIHGIDRGELADAHSPKQVMTTLNERLGPFGSVLCDGGLFDRAWLTTLSKAAGVEPSFELCDVADLFADNPVAQQSLLVVLSEDPAPHRAGPDAERLLRALLRLK